MQILVLTDGGAGMTAQARGLAREVVAAAKNANAADCKISESIANPPAWSRLLPPLVASRFIAPPKDAPEMVIGCGGNAQAGLLAYKRRGAFAVCVQRPAANENAYDAIVAPAHDYAKNKTAANIILTCGAVGMHTPQKLAAARAAARAKFANYRPPYIAILLGGENRAYRFCQTEKLVNCLRDIAQQSGATLLITASRRSPPTLLPALLTAFGEQHYVWNGAGENPYADFLAAADAFVVTADSVNMISEAASAGRTLFLLPLPQKFGFRASRAAKKFSRFHNSLTAQNIARWWSETGGGADGEQWQWFSPPAPPPAETARAAKKVWQMFCAKTKQ